ncbi:hypothetical protein NYE80_25765 [Paenibacillus sp. FSL H7-0357]
MNEQCSADKRYQDEEGYMLQQIDGSDGKDSVHLQRDFIRA